MSKVYNKMILVLDKFVPVKYQPLWNSPAGPKTIFFWAPLMKWGLVIAGLNDLRRDPATISYAQSGALAATGIVWARYSLVVKPVNYSLCAVNVFVGATQVYQLFRAYRYERSLKDKELPLAAAN